MIGHWQREFPGKSGKYWTATRLGKIAGLRVVAYDDQNKLVYADGTDLQNCWRGWWWSEPIEEPAPPMEKF